MFRESAVGVRFFQPRDRLGSLTLPSARCPELSLPCVSNPEVAAPPNSNSPKVGPHPRGAEAELLWSGGVQDGAAMAGSW